MMFKTARLAEKLAATVKLAQTVLRTGDTTVENRCSLPANKLSVIGAFQKR